MQCITLVLIPHPILKHRNTHMQMLSDFLDSLRIPRLLPVQIHAFHRFLFLKTLALVL